MRIRSSRGTLVACYFQKSGRCQDDGQFAGFVLVIGIAIEGRGSRRVLIRILRGYNMILTSFLYLLSLGRNPIIVPGAIKAHDPSIRELLAVKLITILPLYFSLVFSFSHGRGSQKIATASCCALWIAVLCQKADRGKRRGVIFFIYFLWICIEYFSVGRDSPKMIDIIALTLLSR